MAVNKILDPYETYQTTINSVNDHYASKTVGSLGRTFVDWDGDSSIKSDYAREDYNYFRNSSNAIKENRAALLRVCQEAYDRIGIIQNVINLMSDFGSKGVRVRHEVPAVERFCQKWFDRVRGVERSERFLNTLFRLGSVVIYKSFGVLSTKTEQDFKKTQAQIQEDGKIDVIKYKSRYIPISYTFLNPASVEVIGEDLGIALGTQIYVLKLHDNFLHVTNNYMLQKKLSPEVTKMILNGLPTDLKNACERRDPYFPLDEDRVAVYNYKKDDWQSWGKPLTYPLLDDLQVLEKLKLADISALDGAISNIRLWRIGRMGDTAATSLFPTKTMLQKVRNILANNVGGGTLDLVWGPDLDFKESSTNVHQFLGEEKYRPTINAIYDGLGVPSSLRTGGGGASDSKGGNYISLKTLIERLNYGRALLLDFWNKELEVLQKACGFAKPPILEFDYMVFTDEAAEKQLLINLADRDVISAETLREKFNINHRVEESRIKRDLKKRGKKIPNKASPFHNAQPEHDYKKILLTGGTITPSEAGLTLDERKEGEEPRQDVLFKQQKELKDQDSKLKGDPNQGRPSNIKETKKRNPKTGQDIQISKSYDMLLWANSAQAKIHDTIVMGLKDIFGKKNLRSLSTDQHETFERMKCNILFDMEPMQEVNEELIADKLINYKDSNVYEDIKFISSEMQTSFGRELTMDEKRQIYSILYVERKDG